MYGHKARNSIIRILQEAPELADLQVRPTERVNPAGSVNQPPSPPWSKVKGVRARKLADRLLIELWHMGYAVSARVPSDHAPVKGGRDPEVHKAWRNAKLPPPPKTTPVTRDVEGEKATDTP